MHISSHGGHFFHLMEIKARHRVTDTLQLRVASEDAQLVLVLVLVHAPWRGQFVRWQFAGRNDGCVVLCDVWK